jgi:ADP-ribosyl-[dinitrogen reductase] hydrolase
VVCGVNAEAIKGEITMMLEIGVGDAYGGGFEATDKKWVDGNNDLQYVNHPRKLRKNPESYNPSLVQPGHYTDDTQMAIAVAEAMLDDEEPWTRESLADRFLSVFQRDERRGYTTYFLNVLLNSRDGIEMLSKIGGTSTKSGAAMRSGPLGLLPNFREIVDKAHKQAAVTHNSWLGKNSAVGAALMVHYFYYNLGPKDEMCGWLKDQYFGDTIHTPEPFAVDDEVVDCWCPDSGRKVRVDAWDCLEAAIYAIEMHDSMSDILKQCIAFTGDVDTVAAIAMGPASLSKDIKQDIPQHLIDDLENRKYGRDYLLLLDRKLFEKYPRKNGTDEDPSPYKEKHEESLVAKQNEQGEGVENLSP